MTTAMDLNKAIVLVLVPGSRWGEFRDLRFPDHTTPAALRG